MLGSFKRGQDEGRSGCSCRKSSHTKKRGRRTGRRSLGLSNDLSLAKVDPFVQCQRIIDSQGGYSNGIGHAIECQEGYDAFLEMEKMGGKMRDTEDEFVGAPGRDDKTKLVVASRYQPDK